MPKFRGEQKALPEYTVYVGRAANSAVANIVEQSHGKP